MPSMSSLAEQEHRKKVLQELNLLNSGSQVLENDVVDEEDTDTEWRHSRLPPPSSTPSAPSSFSPRYPPLPLPHTSNPSFFPPGPCRPLFPYQSDPSSLPPFSSVVGEAIIELGFSVNDLWLGFGTCVLFDGTTLVVGVGARREGKGVGVEGEGRRVSGAREGKERRGAGGRTGTGAGWGGAGWGWAGREGKGANGTRRGKGGSGLRGGREGES